MPVEATLIVAPSIDFDTLLSITHQALGYNIAGAADASHRKIVDTEKFLSCLAAIKDRTTNISTTLLAHVSFSVLIIAQERDLPAILDIASGISFVCSTTVPNAEVVVLTGTLAQWRDAVVVGTNEAALPTVRICYSKILLLFDRAGLTPIWGDFERRMARNDCGFVLESKQRRM